MYRTILLRDESLNKNIFSQKHSFSLDYENDIWAAAFP